MFRVVLDDGVRQVTEIERSVDAAWVLTVAAEICLTHRWLSPECGCVVYVQTNEGHRSGEWQNAICVTLNDALVFARGL